MKEQLLLSWHTNNEKNLLLMQSIGEEQLMVSLSAKGRTVGEQLAHMHNVRINWTEFVAKPLYEKALLLTKDASLSLPVLSKAFAVSAEKIADVIHTSWEKEGRLPSFKAGLIPFISYLISHESHHRGNILLTLKQNGFKLPNNLKWGLWVWGK
jgi:uncharacterized damage-inducible protein DinB